MAEVLLKKIARAENAPLEAFSAGIAAYAGLPASAEAVEICHDRGMDLYGHRSKPLNKDLVRESDLILTMTEKHKEVILRKMPELEGKLSLLSDFAGEGLVDVEDPVGQSAEEYRKVLVQMEGYIRKVVSRMKG